MEFRDDNAASNRTRQKLAVKDQSKIDRELSNKHSYRQRPSLRVVITKWVSSVIVGVLLLACLVESKLSIITLSRAISVSSDKERARLYIMLQILVLVPNVINLVRAIWSAGFRSDLPWPRKSAFFVGLIVSLLESVGICLFVFNIPILLKIQHIVLLMSCVCIIPVGSIVVKNIRYHHKTCFKIAFASALLLVLIAMAMTGSLIYLEDRGTLSQGTVWMLIVAVFFLSVAWTPAVNSYLVDLKRETRDQATKDDKSPTWKMTIYMSFLKIIFTFIISLLFVEVEELSAVNETNHTHVGLNMSMYRDGWNWSGSNKEETYYFVSNIITGVTGYLLGYIACKTCMQRLSFVVPLMLTTPISIIILSVTNSCKGIILFGELKEKECSEDRVELELLTYASVVCLVLAQVATSGWLIFRSQYIVFLNEDQLFWLPMYNSALLEQWLLLIKKTDPIDVENPEAKAKRSKVIICTTMYREADYEMRQLLESIQGVNVAQSSGGRHFESHIFFDGAVKNKTPTDFVLQLVSLVESTLGVKAQHATKAMTPYGMTLSWRLPAERGTTGMCLTIHLKDSFKVKNKKRWSQVMYMSYVLDFLLRQYEDAREEDSYILTTDADVRFTPDSVEALLDLMTRDHSVGAVCARTHPLGSGPLVWYQVFEYAIGHWFQKAAEHVLGSVLCSPGCFSVYRCKAIRDILPLYASNVEHAFDFLTKDMGEDRWFCTLLVQSGWRIEYCATSENSTHCPVEFDEFFKQRRRWVASTIANIMLLVKEWHIIVRLNHRIPFLFLVYQAILLCFTLIGPSSIILVVSGGLVFGWNLNAVATMVVQLVICLGFTLVCLFASSDMQLTIAKLLTFFYAVLMTVVVVGTAVQITSEFRKKDNLIIDDISTATMYIILVTAIFIIAGILHLREFVYLLHGIWYLLCLPAGYLILMIYSICNITDRSWGTREEKMHSIFSQNLNWQDRVTHTFKSFFFCCFAKPPKMKDKQIQTTSEFDAKSPPVHPEASTVNGDACTSILPEKAEHQGPKQKQHDCNAGNYSDEDSDVDTEKVKHVNDWLPQDMEQYRSNFVENGYENTMFIARMTEKELTDIGITRQGVRQHLMQIIRRLPDHEILAGVPENVDEWLQEIGLEQYSTKFDDNQIKTAQDLEVITSFRRAEIESELNIRKPGHIKRLMQAIRKLRNPTSNEEKIKKVKQALKVLPTHHLNTHNKEEYDYWNDLRNQCLLPHSSAFSLDDDLKERLRDLRNSWLLIFAVSNTVWLILICTLSDKGNILGVFGSNPVGLVVLVLFGLVIIIQFIAMIVHRISTLTHFMGRAPYRCGNTFNTSWAFGDSDQLTPEDVEAQRCRDDVVSRANQKLGTLRRIDEELVPLLADRVV